MPEYPLLGGLAQDTTVDEAVGALGAVRDALEMILSRLGYADPTAGSTRVTIAAGTLPNVTTVGTVLAVGGYSAIYDQYSQMQIGAQGVRSRITIT